MNEITVDFQQDPAGTGVESGAITAFQDKNPVMGMGRAVGHLMTFPEFAAMRFGNLSRLIAGQVNRKHYFFLLQEQKIVGYCGWALTSIEDADAWLDENRPVSFVAGMEGPCCVINIWQASTPGANRAIARILRTTLSDQTHLYARRFYADGRVRRVRLNVNQYRHERVGSAA